MKEEIQQEVNVGDSSPLAIFACDAQGFGDGQCARSFQHQAGKHPWIVDEYLLVMESGAGSKIKLWARDVRVLTGFIIGPKIQGAYVEMGP